MGQTWDRINKTIECIKTDEIDKLLQQCTEGQRKKFGMIFPRGVPDGKFKDAVLLLERTIAKNIKGKKDG